MHALRRILVIVLLGSMPAASAVGAPRPQATAKRKTPVSPAHKKALAELYAGFKFGMTKDEVIAVFSKQLDERYDDKIKATTDIAEQDRLRRDKRNEVNRLQQSYISFDTGKPSPWDVSIVEDEFRHNTGEAMLERWENQGGKNQRRFFFFYDNKLWKMYISLDVSIIPEEKRNFETFKGVMEGQYGAGQVADGTIAWRAGEFDVRAVDRLKNYGALGLAVEDPNVKKEVDAQREAHKGPAVEHNSIINSVIDKDNKDHPDMKANGGAVDAVIQSNGGGAKK